MVKPTSVKDVDQHDIVRQIASFLKKSGKVKVSVPVLVRDGHLLVVVVVVHLLTRNSCRCPSGRTS